MQDQDPAILFVKPKAISAEDKLELKNAGVLVIEINDMRNAKFVRAALEIDSGEMLLAAMRALKGTEYGQKIFAQSIIAALELRDADRKRQASDSGR